MTGFNPECSPANLRVRVAPGLPLDLMLHSSDGLRQDTRARGLDDIPREYNGAIEVPRALFGSLSRRDPRPARLDRRSTSAAGGSRRLRSPSPGPACASSPSAGRLTLDGQPARPDQLRIPPDPGVLLGRLTEQLQDGRGAAAC